MKRIIVTVLLVLGLASHSFAHDNLAQLVGNASDAIVNIRTIREIPGDDVPLDGPFGKMYKHYGADPETKKGGSIGSGFIITSNGFILTNQHVIENATHILVRMSDHRQLVAQVVGVDIKSDIALLKIEAIDLPIVKFGDSDRIRVGEAVFAIGSPYGFDFTVSAGIISAINRTLPVEKDMYVPFIQTDTAINPGNSGGPLLNEDGEVIGINSQIYSKSGASAGIAFAIPINLAMRVVDQLLATGSVRRGWLGIMTAEVEYEYAIQLGMEYPQGALITHVVAGGPLSLAGGKIGDVVLSFDGVEIYAGTMLPALVSMVLDSREIVVVILRGTERIELLVTPLSTAPSKLPFDEDR